MLSDFVLVAALNGEPREFVVREVPTAVFFLGFQESYPGADCFGPMAPGKQRSVLAGMEAWTDALLCRVAADPRLTPELVQRLGSARDELARGYLAAVGWPVHPKLVEDLVPATPIPGPRKRRHWPADRAALIAVPTPSIKTAMREIAVKARTAPYTVWSRWGISEFIWTWRVVLEEELKKRAARSPMGESGLVARVGREAS